MFPTDLSSLKWGDDGELSSRDTWNLVKRLIKVELGDRGVLECVNDQRRGLTSGEDNSIPTSDTLTI